MANFRVKGSLSARAITFSLDIRDGDLNIIAEIDGDKATIAYIEAGDGTLRTLYVHNTLLRKRFALAGLAFGANDRIAQS